MNDPSFLKEYRSVASTLAAVSTYLGSYSLIDRMSNALSPDSANRVIYEMSRILNSVSKEKEQKIRPYNENNKRGILVIREDGNKFFIGGDLAETSEIELFLEDVEKNPHIARSLAALAMYLSARAQFNSVVG
ncbi:MAG: type I-A CRISPR-associated protein Csa5 [Candidatus Methanosuratincola petrocarbonis]